MPGASGGCPLEDCMLHEMCQTVGVGTLIAAPGPYGHSYIAYEP